MDPYEFEALRDITVDGVAAFRKGDGVPAGHVKRHALTVGEDVQARSSDAGPSPTESQDDAGTEGDQLSAAQEQGDAGGGRKATRSSRT